jgi:hypothetical protein
VDSAAASGPWLVLDSIPLAEWKRDYAPRNPERPALRIRTLIIRLDSIVDKSVIASHLMDMHAEWRLVAADSVAFDNRGWSFAPSSWRFSIARADIRGVATMGHDLVSTGPSGEFVPHVSMWSAFGLPIPCVRVPLVRRLSGTLPCVLAV